MINNTKVSPSKGTWHDETVQFIGTIYQDRQSAIIVIDDDTSEPLAKATVNFGPEEGMSRDMVYIKEYSENHGITKALIDAKIIAPQVYHTKDTGYVSVMMYKIIDKNTLTSIDHALDRVA